VISVRLVRLTLADGTNVVGIVPAEHSDAELTRVDSRIEVTFSDAMQVPEKVALGKVLQKIAIAKQGEWH